MMVDAGPRPGTVSPTPLCSSELAEPCGITDPEPLKP
jgi:hypothetical protein